MPFSCGLLFNFYTNKLKKFSIGFKSGLFGEVLNTGSPTRAAAHRAVIVFCLRHLSIKNLFSTGLCYCQMQNEKLNLQYQQIWFLLLAQNIVYTGLHFSYTKYKLKSLNLKIFFSARQ